MILIETNKLQLICKKMLLALDSQNNMLESEVIEIKSVDNHLHFSLTNKEYYVSFPLRFETTLDPFIAVVNAKLFLNLIAKITTPQIEISVVNQSLKVKGNGEYTLPMVYDGDELVKVVSLVPENIISDFELDTDYLKSIAAFNTLELLKPSMATVEQRLFYIDESGCVTFGHGACINNFSLNTPVKLLLNDKVVKLFKLLVGDRTRLQLGYDPIANNLFLTKVCFMDGEIQIAANITANNSYLNTFPAEYLRAQANYAFPYNLVVDKNSLLSAISRLKLFSASKDVFIPLKITADTLDVYDSNKVNCEHITLVNSVTNLVDEYNCVFFGNELESLLKSCNEQYITIKFGDHNRGLVIERGNIKNLLPECSE